MTEKRGKVEVRRKRWVLALPPYSPIGNGRQSPGWNHLTRGIDHLTRGEPRKPVSTKALRTSERIPDIFTRITRVRAP